MEYTTVQGTDVPAIGLGTWQNQGATCRRAVEMALEMGYRHVDTAAAYDNERAVGVAIDEADVDREELFLTTKVDVRNAGYDDAIESAERSLTRLGVEYVDLLLLHWPNPIVDVAETMRAFDALVDRGMVRHIGVSNFGVDRLQRARRAADNPIFADQVQFHPFHPQRELLRYCQDHDILLTAYSPLAQGGVLTDPMLEDIGRKYDKTAAQVALRWATLHRNVVAIPKASSREHLEQNLDIFDFTLTRDEMDRIARPSKLRSGIAMARGRLGV